MEVIRITREFSFETAHALDGYDGACSQIHGHSYRFYVTVQGAPLNDTDSPKDGMVIDFRLLKKLVGKVIVDRYDHAMIIRSSKNNVKLIQTLKEYFERIEVVDYQPTCENLVTHFAAMLHAELPKNIKLHSLRLHETANSFAEWFASDN